MVARDEVPPCRGRHADWPGEGEGDSIGEGLASGEGDGETPGDSVRTGDGVMLLLGEPGPQAMARIVNAASATPLMT